MNEIKIVMAVDSVRRARFLRNIYVEVEFIGGGSPPAKLEVTWPRDMAPQIGDRFNVTVTPAKDGD